ncbi:MAG: glycosyltransferase [Methylococcaceae bacterium]|nr:glycosyltransferase [Methylococcaceae bacterium]
MADCLSISLVIYHPDETLLHQTLQTLFVAAAKTRTAGLIERFYLTIVDNTEQAKVIAPGVTHTFFQALDSNWANHVIAFHTPGNIGYGAGHNLAIRTHCEAFHLVVNPDVVLHEDALIECIRYLQKNPQVGLVTPLCHRPDGQQESLCKTYPSVWILLLRGFAPTMVKRHFQRQLAAYESNYPNNANRQDILIASGCFMFFRRDALQGVQGFCEQFFLYFEDFDLSLRLTKNWQIAYVPTARIVHYGGHSAKKGFRHIRLFVHSAWIFFKRHGWRIW